jgi:O-antigen ligase
MTKVQINKRHSNFIIVLLLLFPVLINSVKIFSSLILLILAVLGIHIAITERKNPFKIKELKVFSWITIGYFSIILLSILVADGFNAELNHLGRKVQFLLAPLIALTIYQIDLPLKKLLLSIKLGLIIIGIITITQFLLGNNRPSGMINQNIFGDIAVIMLFLSIAQVFIETPKERVITFIATSSGIIAIFLSGSRGSWLSFLILSITYIALIYRPFLQNNNKRKIFLILLFPIFAMFMNTYTDASKQIKDAVSNVENWNSGNISLGSGSERLEMWKAGLIAAKHSPFFGHGYRNANKVSSEYTAPNNKRNIRIKTHLHNEYITNLVSAGIVGLLALLALLFSPIIIFYQKLKNNNTYYYALMGILLCISYITFGFTHIALGEEHMNSFYVLFMGFLLPQSIRRSI